MRNSFPNDTGRLTTPDKRRRQSQSLERGGFWMPRINQEVGIVGCLHVVHFGAVSVQITADNCILPRR